MSYYSSGGNRYSIKEIINRGIAKGPYGGTEATLDPLFVLNFLNSGTQNLSNDITINGTTVSPTLMYEGKNLTGTTSWIPTIGDTLTASSASYRYNLPTPFNNETDKSIINTHPGYGFVKTADNTYPGLTTEDYIWEIIFSTSDLAGAAGALSAIFYKRATMPSYFLRQSGSSMSYIAHDGTTQLSNLAIGISLLPPYSWYHLLIIHDRSSGIQAYANGVAGTADARSCVNTLNDTSTPFVLAAQAATGSNNWNGNLVRVALWKAPSGWLNSYLQPTFAQQRFFALMGLSCSSTDYSFPTNFSRASFGISEKWITTSSEKFYYRTGNHWPRIVVKKDDTGKVFTGYLGENAATNLIFQSEDIGRSLLWAKTNSGDIVSPLASGIPSPVASGLNPTAASSSHSAYLAEGLVTDTTTANHGLTITVSGLSATKMTLSVYGKQNLKSWLYLSNNTVSNANGYFDLGNTTTGTIGSAISNYGIENINNSWKRLWISFNATAGNNVIQISGASGDGGVNYAGTGYSTNSPDFYVWGAQLETGDYPTSYIYTANASATRVKDDLRYASTNHIGLNEGTLFCEYLYPNIDNLVSNNYLLSLNSGTAANEIALKVDSNDYVSGSVIDNSVNQATTSGIIDVCNNQIHNTRISYKTNSVKFYSDGTTITQQDTSATIPVSGLMTTINIGQDATEANAFGPGIIGNIQIFNKQYGKKINSTGV